MVEAPLPAVIGEVALTVDCAADTVPAFTTTVAVCLIASAFLLALLSFPTRRSSDLVPVATPLAFVVVTGCVSVLPDPVAASTTVAPGIGLPLASRAVTVIVDVPPPAVIGEMAVTVDCAADTAPAFTTTVTVWVTPIPLILAETTTVAVCVIATVLMVADTVLDSATSELSVPVATPLAFVGPPGCVSVFVRPVAVRTTVAP